MTINIHKLVNEIVLVITDLSDRIYIHSGIIAEYLAYNTSITVKPI